MRDIAMRKSSLLVSALVVVGLGAATVACSSTTKPAPENSAPPAAVQSTEKAAIKPPPRAFNQNMNAADGISALESEGYNVEINWGGGRQDQNLSLCRIGNVDGLRGSGSVKPGTSVYVTVIC